jgi:hypothetical protein
MTQGGSSPTNRHCELHVTRRVSSLNDDRDGVQDSKTRSTDEDDCETVAEEPNTERTRKSRTSSLSRQVSHDGLISFDQQEEGKGGAAESDPSSVCSSVRCVSECPSTSMQTFPNPLHNANLLRAHTFALRLEADLHPMRLILSRLMAHPTLNRKGVFNQPVDPVALGLPDYHLVIREPMDFGTIKCKLHSILYMSRLDVAKDIQRVFGNAMKYNPPTNYVHLCAKELQVFYIEQIGAFAPDLLRQSQEAKQEMERLVAAAVPSLSGKICGESVSTNPVYTGKRPAEAFDSVGDAIVAPSDDHLLAVSKEVSSTINAAQDATASTPVQIQQQATRKSNAPLDVSYPRRRRMRGSLVKSGHACDHCQGRTCAICLQKCLCLEPTLLICNGAQCAGARIRKAAVYFIAKDGSRQFCQRCHLSLPAVLPSSGQDDVIRYKRDLLKRKNDEEIAERWLVCTKCNDPVHQMCAMHDEYAHSEVDYQCPSCVVKDASADFEHAHESESDMYTFCSGSNAPVKLSDLVGCSLVEVALTAEALPETAISAFIQEKVREVMKKDGCPNAEKTVSVRVISNCERYFKVPDAVRTHFQMATLSGNTAGISPPTQVHYRSKSIALFQKIDGLDVCIFCMYVQEYDGNDEFEEMHIDLEPQKKRIYIAYLDSVEHFRPRTCRTQVYHEMLVAYLASARIRGYEQAHIWACPPSRGNSFVFWNHPASQRTPSRDRLVSWYHGALSRALDCGVVTDVKSFYETDFQYPPTSTSADCGVGQQPVPRIFCPPLLDGDFWVEEAVRVHSLSVSRHVRAKTSDLEVPSGGPDGSVIRCPAVQVARVLYDLITNPCAAAFRKPVNAVALRLKDYHEVITKPMDLATVYSHLVLGEYRALKELVSDVELVFSNATRYNPKGHFVHEKAVEVSSVFFAELNKLVASWVTEFDSMNTSQSWEAFADMSMSLDKFIGDLDVETSDNTSGAALVNAEGVGLLSPAIMVDLRLGGPHAIEQRMIGNDTWLLDKTQPALRGINSFKKNGNKRRKCFGYNDDETATKRPRCQSWLSLEVSAAVRRMRADFFMCSLSDSTMSKDDASKSDSFDSYARGFVGNYSEMHYSSKIADVRHALLEFSQFRNLEFDTLRRAKYSTAVILYHLHGNDGSGMVPTCTCCQQEIEEVRWHKLGKIRSATRAATKSFRSEELCSRCYASQELGEQFIPVQVSLPPQGK